MSQDYAGLEKRLREWALIAQGQGDRVSPDASPHFSAEDRADIKAGFYAQRDTLTEAADAISALTQKLEERDRVAVEAVEFIGVMRDEMAMAGWPPGDRAVLLANFREMLKQSCLSRADAAEDAK